MRSLMLTASCLGLAATIETSAQTNDNFVPVADAMPQNPGPADWLIWRRTLDDSGYRPRA